MASAEGRTCVDIRIKLSVKETKQVNRRTRQSLASELGMKCNAICVLIVTIDR